MNADGMNGGISGRSHIRDSGRDNAGLEARSLSDIVTL